MTDLALNDEQAVAILTEGLSRGLYESLNNAIPQDPAQRLQDATELTKAAQAAFNNGNRSDNVQTILFISQVDQKPLSQEEQKVAEAVANDETVIVEKRESEASNIHNGLDLSTLSDGVIEGLIVGLDKYPPSEQVEEDRKAYLAEKERRENEKAGKSQDDSSGTTAQALGEKAGEAAPEGSPAPVEGGNQTASEGGAANRDAGQEIGSGEVDSAQGEDAGAFARAQTPETSPEGKPAKAKKTKEDGNRLELEEQLTLPIVKAHGIDITKLDSLSVEQIEYMIENPSGPTEEKKMPVNELEAEASAVTNKEVKAVSGISADESISPERIVSKKDLGLEGVEEPSGANPADEFDRESLEAQVTGPCLKAYGRGRKEIPTIGVNELRFMIEHPDGKVDPSELEAAREIDNLGKKVVEVVREVDREEKESPVKGIVDKEVAGPEKVDHFLPEKDRTIAQAAQEAVNKNPFEEEAVSKSPPVEEVRQKIDSGMKRLSVAAEKADRHSIEENKAGQNRAEEIIAREGFPIPPAYSEEQAPEFPVDMSKCTRDELYSFHAEFHAYETRINYILIEYEDRLNDWAHKRSYREAVVAKSVPFMGEDGKRNTNEYRDVQVKGDEEVLDLSNREHEAKKVVNDLKAFQKNFHLSCERLSRQMSKYENEMRDAPR